MKSPLAIKRELARVERAHNRELKRVGRERIDTRQRDFDFLNGARQALAWALEDNAVPPTQCIELRKPKKRGKR